MTNKNKNLLSVLCGVALLAAAVPASANNTIAPSSLVVKAYEVWASTHTDCSSPVKVIDNGASGKTVDVVQGIDFGAGTLPPAGTYECLVLVISDTQTMVPSVTGTTLSGVTQNDLCIAGTTYTQDTCGTGSSSPLPDGTTTTCGTAQEDKVAAYLSTAGTLGGDGHNAAAAKLLNSSIVVSSSSVDKTFFISDPDGLVNQNSSCGSDANTTLGLR